MKTKFILLACIIIGFINTGALCSKENEVEEEEAPVDNYVEPAFAADSTWWYMENESFKNYYYNERPAGRKWVATKFRNASSLPGTTPGNTDKNSFSLALDNTDKFTRFMPDKHNPGGKETVNLYLTKFNRTPGAGTYFIPEGFSNGFIEYNVYNTTGKKVDSTRIQKGTDSQLNITAMTFDRTISTTADIYLISGTATLHVWRSGYNEDTHVLNCKFNKVPVMVFK